MKKILACALIFCALITGAACAQETTLTRAQYDVFDAVRYSTALPKDAQVQQAMEYFIKIDGMQLHLLLIQATQHEMLKTVMGEGAELLLVDMDTGDQFSFFNVVWPESDKIGSKQDALNLLFNAYCSYAYGYSEMIWADHEITYPLTQEDIDAVNGELRRIFTK